VKKTLDILKWCDAVALIIGLLWAGVVVFHAGAGLEHRRDEAGSKGGVFVGARKETGFILSARLFNGHYWSAG